MLHKTNTNIAIIYFSRTLHAESKEKQWFKNEDNYNKVIASSLITTSYKVVCQSGLPVFHFHEGNQKGKTFGEKLANAYSEVFNLGYTGIIAVGNDSPELGQINWNHVATQLANGQCVLGPSIRGGAYFIGLTKQAFDKEKFIALPWQTNALFQALCNFCILDNQVPYIIERLRDINSIQDLQLILKSTRLSRSFKKLLLLLFGLFTNILFEWNNLLVSYRYLSLSTPLRAPPYFS